MNRRGADRTSGDAAAEPSRWLLALTIVLCALLALVLYAMAFTEWRRFFLPDDMNNDLAWFNQGFYRAVHDHGWIRSTVSEMGTQSIIGVHFSPVFFLVLPFYVLWQSPLLLMFVSACAVATMGITVVLVARRIFHSDLLALFWFALFALYPPVAWSVQLDGFRELYLSMAFLSLALLFYLEERYWLFFPMLLLAIMGKEDIALLVPVWGLVAWLQRRDWRLTGSLVLLGAAYFIFANAIALPMIRGTPIGRTYFVGFGSPLGQTTGGLLQSLLSRPGDVVRLLVSGDTLAFWVPYLGPLLFLPLAGWEYLVIPAYLYLEIAFQPRPLGAPIRYIAPAFPFLFVGAMVGMSRLMAAAGRLASASAARARVARGAVLAALLCGMVALMFHVEDAGHLILQGAPLPVLIGENWPGNPVLSQDAALLRALERIPARAPVAATQRLISQISSRDVMDYLALGGPYIEQALAQKPDYVVLDIRDLDGPHLPLLASLLCQGVYGVVYTDNVGGYARMILERGAGLSQNQVVYERYLPGPHHPCPEPLQQVIGPREFQRAAGLHVRTVASDMRSSEIRATEMFPEPVTGSGSRFAQVIRLPDQTFGPGWYRLDLSGAWPWPSAPVSSRLMVHVLVGDREVGQVTLRGDQRLHYTTPPFQIERRATLPVRVQAGLEVPKTPDEPSWVLRPSRDACAIVADAPSLNPQRVTVQALIYLNEAPRRGEADFEAPILTKKGAPGYYLRVSGNATGSRWIEFSAAGKFGLGQAGVDAVPVRRWTQITATYDGREARIYIDGDRALQDSSRNPNYTGPIRSEGVPLVIGCQGPQRGARAFPGLIASARVWNRALTSEEIHAGPNWAGPPDSLEGLVGDWRWQSVAGDIIPDLSDSGNPIINGGQLTRVPAPEIRQPLAAWGSRELDLLRTVTVSGVPAARVRGRFPSALGPEDLFPERGPAVSEGRAAQIIHLPDHTFDPGWYRLELTGAWPRPSVPAAYRVTARVLVGSRTVGRVTVDGDQPLRYATPPFHVGRRETLPIRVEADLSLPADREGQTLAFRPAEGGCATVADAPNLNPQQVTVEALIDLSALSGHPGGEAEAPILSKNSAAGYYLRLSGDEQGRHWIEFSVAGKWALGRAGVDAVPFNRWTAIAATYDGQEARIYVNGHPAAQEASHNQRYAGSIRSQDAPLLIGCRGPGQPYRPVFPGLIGGGRVWNRVLSPQEVHDGAGIWALPARGVRGLVGNWGFQTVEGGIIPDLSASGNPIINGGRLARVPAAEIRQNFQHAAAWQSWERGLLREVTVTSVPSARVREQFPSVLGPGDVFPGPVVTLSDTRISQVIHLPEHTFEPGWYRLDLTGAWPRPSVLASYRVMMRVHVGSRTVGQVTVEGDQPLRYTTPAFRIERHETLPVAVQADLWVPEGRAGQTRALRPSREGCAVVADAPSLNPEQVTVEALVYLDDLPRHPGAETEAPILSKNNAPGYYLRLAGDDQGKMWLDLGVAGKGVLGRADVGPAFLRRWAALAGTYDGQEARLYINGDQAPQVPLRSSRYAGRIQSERTSLYIGCRDAGKPYEVVFPGLIGAARVWNRTLSAEEIQGGAGTWPRPARSGGGLVGAWAFQGGPGDAIPDLSGARNPVTNGGQLTYAAAPAVAQPFSGWRSGGTDLLRSVQVRKVTP